MKIPLSVVEEIPERAKPSPLSLTRAWIPVAYRSSGSDSTISPHRQPITPTSSGIAGLARSMTTQRSNSHMDEEKFAESTTGPQEYFFQTTPKWQSVWFYEYWSELTALFQRAHSDKDAFKVHTYKSARSQSVASPKVVFVKSKVSQTLQVIALVVDPRKHCEQVGHSCVCIFIVSIYV